MPPLRPAPDADTIGLAGSLLLTVTFVPATILCTTPGEPCVPVAPVAPCGPVFPIGPCGPVAPVFPVGPWTPCGPCGPVAPVAPVFPIGPCGPVAPVAPWIPCGPCGPVAPCAIGMTIFFCASIGTDMIMNKNMMYLIFMMFKVW